MSESTGPLPPLDWLRSFEAAARHGSFTRAARELGLTQAAVSQQIRKLEEELARPLFFRLARRVALTEDGAAYLPHVQAAFAQLARSTRDLFKAGRARESVTLRSPISFAALWLAPRLPRLQQALPHLHLSLATVHLPEDYQPEGDDLEIRFGTGGWPGRKAWRLAEESLVPAAAPSLLARAPQDWMALPLIGLAGPRESWAAWCAQAGLPPPTSLRLRFDTFLAALEAAKAGAGVLLGSRPLMDGALRGGELRLLSDKPLVTARAHYLVRDDSRPPRPAVAELIAWLRRDGRA